MVLGYLNSPPRLPFQKQPIVLSLFWSLGLPMKRRHTCGQGGSTFWRRGSWAARQAEEEALLPASRWLLADDPLCHTTASPGGWKHTQITDDAWSSFSHFNSPTRSKYTHSLRVALALTVEHLGASLDWRETGHLRMVSPSSGTQKNWNLLGIQ